MRSVQVFILFLLGVLSVIAAPAKKAKSTKMTEGVPYVHAEVPELVLPEMNLYTNTQFDDEVKEAKKRGQRQVAATLTPQADFAAYRDRFLALKDTPNSSQAAEELDKILFELELKAEKPGMRSDDLEFFAAQLIQLRSFRGFFHKVRPLARKYPIVQSYLVTLAKQMATNVNIFLVNNNSQNMKVVFRYISEPYQYTAFKNIGGKEVSEAVVLKIPGDSLKNYGLMEFENENDIQNWLNTNVLPRLNISITKLRALNLKNKNIVWDNRIFAGGEAYPNPADQYRSLGEAEKNSVLSNLYGNYSNILVFNSYSAFESLKLVRELGYLYGVEQMDIIGNAREALRGDETDVVLKGASAEERTNKINKFIASQRTPKRAPQGGYHRLFTLLPAGEANMRAAYSASLSSNMAANLAWTEIKQRKDDDSVALDGAIFRPFIRVSDESLNLMTTAIKGALTDTQMKALGENKLVLSGAELDKHFVPIHSAISPDVVSVNVVKFFFAPPRDLKDFLPHTFEQGPWEFNSDVKDASGKTVTYRNYFKGTVKTWKENSFKPYFRMSKGSQMRAVGNSDDIRTILRVTHQSWGGLMIGATLNSIML